ncbi:hypothetical protein KZ849_16125, partial [Pseudomonas aeruginosa]|nr:hypothetical protein [Pseudomonas aeruginosa]
MRKSLLVIAFGLLSAQAALAGDSTKTAVGGGVGGALGNVVGGAIGGSTGAATVSYTHLRAHETL